MDKTHQCPSHKDLYTSRIYHRACGHIVSQIEHADLGEDKRCKQLEKNYKTIKEGTGPTAPKKDEDGDEEMDDD
jgi:hypothetical protein